MGGSTDWFQRNRPLLTNDRIIGIYSNVLKLQLAVVLVLIIVE